MKESCQSVFFTLLEMEEDNLNPSNVYFKLLEIHNEFESNNNEQYKHVINACKLKLEKYLFGNGMPSMKLFKSMRILDPLFFKLNEVDFNEHANEFPELKNCLQEMAKYKLICKDLRNDINVKDFWAINKNSLPKLFSLSKVFLHFPVSTACVERSFSKYNIMLADDRHRLKPETIKSLLYLYYNKNIDTLNASLNDIDNEENEIIIMSEIESDGSEDDKEDDDVGNMSGIDELEIS